MAAPAYAPAPNAGYCPGKLEWPELVGVEAWIAGKIIEIQNPNVHVVFIKCNAPRILDFRCDRVWVDFDIVHGGDAIVCKTPRVG